VRTRTTTTHLVRVTALLIAGTCWQAVTLPGGASPARADEQEEDAAVERAALRAIERVAPSIVMVETLGGLEEGFEAPESAEEAEGGVLARAGFKQAYGPSTGLIVGADGLVLVSSFVLNRDPTHVFVTRHDGTTYVAQVVARDHAHQLVLLRIPAEGLPVAPLADEEDQRVGRWTLALGRGLGGDQLSVSRGIISAVGRVGGRAIQSSAAISPVNYGGPLVSIEGEVLGAISSMSMQGGQAAIDIYDSGIGFAVPAHRLPGIVARLARGRDLHPGVLGVVPNPMDRGQDGVLVGQVAPGSPAAAAGVQVGDKIVRIDGKPTLLDWQLRRVLSQYFAGDTIRLVVRRAGQDMDFEARLIGPGE
jgi:S1-C subfamily serine protease